MNQSRLESIIEQVLNNLSGIVTSLLTFEYIIAPFYGFDATWWDNIGITIIFTTISIIRGYFWRRFFNNLIHKKVHNYIKSFF